MKITSKFLLILFLTISCCNLFASDNLINRRLICLYNSLQNEDSFYNSIHQRIEVELNYFGYFCDYYDVNNLPEKTENYSGIIYWASSNEVKDPIFFYNWLIKNKKNKKIVLLGDIPTQQGKNDLSKKINLLLKENFGFYIGHSWFNNKANINIEKKDKIFDFEMPLLSGTIVDFRNIVISSDKIKPLLTLAYMDGDEKVLSNPVFIAPWGAVGIEDKIFYSQNNRNRWLINPFKFVRMIFNTDYPVPDTTTINGKRILYLHIDGDSAQSISEVIPGEISAKVWLEKIGRGYPDFKIGVSFIAADLDPEYAGNRKIQQVAKETFALPNVETASHTYTHPLSWQKALVVFAKKTEKLRTAYYGGKEHIKAFVTPSGEVEHNFEIIGSIKFLDKFAPKDKPVKVIYWSGDCLPTEKDLEIIEKNHLLAFNNGDTFLDLQHNSYSYVTPVARDVNGLKQIYSSDSNEDVYTDLWTDKFWGFKNVVVTFKRTGYPIRIKPVNLYYHFYSVEKIAAYNALLYIYKFLENNKKNFINIFPSRFIKIVKNFFTVKIYKTGENRFLIKNANNIKEFRFKGKVKVDKVRNIDSVHYNRKLNVTYITIGSGSEAEMVIHSYNK